MPDKLPVSLILVFVSLILSAIMMRMSEITGIALIINFLLLLIIRYISKIEDDSSLISIFLILASLLLTAIIIEPAFASVIVIMLNAVTLAGMRHTAKIEAGDAKLTNKPLKR